MRILNSSSPSEIAVKSYLIIVDSKIRLGLQFNRTDEYGERSSSVQIELAFENWVEVIEQLTGTEDDLIEVPNVSTDISINGNANS